MSSCTLEDKCSTMSSVSSTSRCLDDHFDSENTDQYDDDDSVDFNINMRNSVARTTASGIELLVVYIEAELRRVRFFLRDCGVRLRRFCAEALNIDFRRIAQLLRAITETRLKQMQIDPLELNKDEAMIFNTVPLRSRWKPPKFTFNDIAVVLTSDEKVEDGVIHAYTIRSPAWDRLPSPILSRQSREDLRDFQLFNRPMEMMVRTDDDDDRLSIPSTMATDQELKIQSLEAQLALLSKQMQLLLADRVPPPTPASGSLDISPIQSDDEGKGPSLCSPTNTSKTNIPRSCSGGIPPPPPPPPPSLFSSSTPVARPETPKRSVLQMLNKSSTVEHNTLPVRPTALDLKNVQLKKTNTARSPGGTPVFRQSASQSSDEGNYLAKALREKFRSIHDCLSEHEEDVSTSWIEDEA